MTPTQEPQQISAAQWIEGLSATEQRQLIFLAVTNHPVKFTNAQEVADRWFSILTTTGYQGLCKHAKKWLALEFLKLHAACSA